MKWFNKTLKWVYEENNFRTILYVLVVLFAIGILTGFDGWLWKFVDASATIITLLLVVVDLQEGKKQLEKTEILVQYPNGEEKALPIYLIRKNISRSEVFGLLGGLHKSQLEENKESKKNSNDFQIVSIQKDNGQFLKDILDIQQGKKDKLVIKLSKDDKFGWKG